MFCGQLLAPSLLCYTTLFNWLNCKVVYPLTYDVQCQTTLRIFSVSIVSSLVSSIFCGYLYIKKENSRSNKFNYKQKHSRHMPKNTQSQNVHVHGSQKCLFSVVTFTSLLSMQLFYSCQDFSFGSVFDNGLSRFCFSVIKGAKQIFLKFSWKQSSVL